MKEEIITLTKEELEYLRDVVCEHIENIGNTVFYGTEEDDKSMKDFLKTILKKLSK